MQSSLWYRLWIPSAVVLTGLLGAGATTVFAHADHVETERIALRAPHPDQAALEAAFEEAAADYGVPASILKVVGFVESRWVHTGPTVDYGYGIMHLVNNSDSQTLVDAAKLTGYTIEQLMTDPIANIRGGAAVIAKYAETTVGQAQSLEDYWEALKLFSGLNPEVQAKQARTYYEVLAEGAGAGNNLGMQIDLPAESVDLSLIGPEDDGLAVESDDYGPAIWNPAASCNYETTRYGTAIDHWINHWIGSGTYAGTISWFKNCAAETSSHFVIRQSDGQITQMVRIAHRAWTTGYMNSRSIGVEHEATPSYPWPQSIDAPMIVASATACRHFCNVYGIPKTRTYITGHSDYYSTACPGNLPWDVYLARVNNIPPAVTGQPSARNACPGTSVQFSTSASGYGVSYRWQRNNADISDGGKFSGTGGTTLTVSSIDGTVTGNYRCKISNFAGTVYSSAAGLTLKATTAVTANPTSLAKCIGETAQFTAAGTGTGTVSVRWQKNGSNLTDGGLYSGTTSWTLTVANVNADAAGDYRAVVSAECGSATSTAAQLTLKALTEVTQPPVDQAICPGGSASFTAAGTGDGTVTYQWQRDGLDINDDEHFSGTASPNLLVSDVDGTVLGDYRCVIEATCGTAATPPARLTMRAPTALSLQPEPIVAPLGATARMSVAAVGAGLQFQWLKDEAPLADGESLSGTQTPVLIFRSIAPEDEGSYTCQVSGACGLEVSQPASLVLGSGGPGDLGPTYQFGPVDINAGGAPAAVNEYGLIASTGQAGGVGIIEMSPYLLDNGFWAVALARPLVIVPPDFDQDGDVDGDDFEHLDNCFTGPALGPPTQGCEDADLDGDNDVDQGDFGLQQRCFSGPNVSSTPGCMEQ